MRKDKEYVFELRKAGKTYRQIQIETGISRGTLSDWFRGIEWSRHIAATNEKRTTSSEQLEKMRIARKKNLDNLYSDAERKAEIEYISFKNEPLFWAGLMAYAGEGDKRTRHIVRITNTEFYIHTIFIKFAVRYLKIEQCAIKCCLILYPDLNESLCKEMWSNLLGINRQNFHKTQIIQGKEKIKRLQYGIGMSIITSTVLKKKVLKWLSLAQNERFNIDATIV